MAGIGQMLSRTFFWTYERGTWQYDLAVILILIFVLLTPNKWFHEQPQTGVAPYPGEVKHLASPSASGATDTYRVDARILAPPKQTPALENDLHHALQRALPDELGSGRFAITKISPVRDESGTVIAYDVEIQH
jgi:hypothetical protein